MIPRLSVVTTADPYRLYLKYVDGVSGRFDMWEIVSRSPVFKYFLDHPTAFRDVHIDEYGGIIRDDERDICADNCYITLTWKNPFI